MKELTRIHLAKIPYNIELGAKKQLKEYLLDIENTMQASSEMMREIEVRITELLSENKVSKDGVITEADVKFVRDQMGEPQDFSDQTDQTDQIPEQQTTSAQEKSSKKQLMRDQDKAVVGGVCAGLAAYFDVSLIWVRLIAFALIFVSGLGLLLYAVLWIITPVAKTTTDKLIMRGEPVTFESLERVSADKNSKQEVSLFLKISQIISSIFFAFVSIGALIATLLGAIFGFDFVRWMSGLNAQPWLWSLLSTMVVAGIALTLFTALLAYIIFVWRVRKPVGIALVSSLVIGILTIPMMAIFGLQAKYQLSVDRDQLVRTIQVELPKDLKGVKYIEPIGSVNHWPNFVDGDQDEKISVELKYLRFRNLNIPKVSTKIEGDTLLVTVTNQSESLDCPYFLPLCKNYLSGNSWLRVSGPLKIKNILPYDGYYESESSVPVAPIYYNTDTHTTNPDMYTPPREKFFQTGRD